MGAVFVSPPSLAFPFSPILFQTPPPVWPPVGVSTRQAEDQFQTALRAHLQNMDQLIDLQDSRLLALEQEFEVELQTLQKARL